MAEEQTDDIISKCARCGEPYLLRDLKATTMYGGVCSGCFDSLSRLRDEEEADGDPQATDL